MYQILQCAEKNLKEVNTILNTSCTKMNDNDIDALLANYKRVTRNVSNYHKRQWILFQNPL